MPEYLAPGVYVEETSFRAKSIEGVGTSTTGFVGPARGGPVGGTPELITSFGDFSRIYGGLDDLSYGPNYLAHSVRNYFNEGGSRLYVSRAYLPAAGGDGRATSAVLAAGATPADQARFVARFPGRTGNGHITVRQATAAATVRSMAGAPEGTLLRVGGADPARPARIEGGIAPFALPNDGHLLLTVGGTDADVTLHGEPAEAVGTTALPDSLNLDATNNSLQVVIDGIAQTIPLPTGATPRADLAVAANQALRGGYVRLTDDHKLAVGSDWRGTQATVTVNPNAALGFPAAVTISGANNPANNVGDALRVTVDEINAVLVARGVPARVALVPENHRVVLTSVATGPGASLAVRTGPGSVNTALGLAAGPPVPGAGSAPATYYVKAGTGWVDAGGAALNLTGLGPLDAPGGHADFLSLTLVTEDNDGKITSYENLGFDSRHPRWVGNVLATQPTRRSDALEHGFALDIHNVSGLALRDGLFGAADEHVVTVSGGGDGAAPNQAAYEAALAAFETLEDISIVAAPGSSAYADSQGIMGALISHAERRKAYRIAVLDTPPGQLLSEAQTVRSRIDSTYAALYYPWVVVSNPLARPGADNIPAEITLPPSGFVCGIYARNDVQRGVYKAPANEVVRGALRFETDINFAQQEVLNPLGINCLRFFAGRGYRVWGARTVSSDPEWKYVNVRRYFNFLESSIDRGTQWAVFEPNGERLWANVRDTITAFLYNEWVGGALLGGSPKEAFFVRCDRSTMTQNDLDNGRLICLIGVAVLKPAEFVIFRIGQKTADARS